MVDKKIEELIAIGASVSANCHPCIKFHLGKATKLQIPPEDIKTAIQVGRMVRGGAAGQMDQLLSEIGKEHDIDLEIIDIFGRPIYDDKLNNNDGSSSHEVDISSSNDGLYLIQLIQGEKKAMFKLVKE